MPTTPVRKLTKGKRPHLQRYHVSTKMVEPEPIVELVPAPKGSPLVPPRKPESTETTTATGLRVITYAGRTATYAPGLLLHSENDQPSEVWDDGSKAWNRYDVLHRFGGPALIHRSGGGSWYENGELHRDYGPAVMFGEGTPEYWVRGQQYPDQDAADAATASTLDWDRRYNNGDLERDPENLLARQSGIIDPRATARQIERRQAAAEDPRATPETLDLLIQDSNRNVSSPAIAALSRRNRWRQLAEREAVGSDTA